jgi:hypothetical protein|tara:strand:- start:339 stop:509 length:171 start_codon:yes stop_codon:yes gene_type:complete
VCQLNIEKIIINQLKFKIMKNKPIKKERGLERIVQLVCVAIAVFGILLFGLLTTSI